MSTATPLEAGSAAAPSAMSGCGLVVSLPNAETMFLVMLNTAARSSLSFDMVVGGGKEVFEKTEYVDELYSSKA